MVRKFFLRSVLFVIVVIIPIAIYLLLSGPHMVNQPSIKAFERKVNMPPVGSVPIKNIKKFPPFITHNPLIVNTKNISAGKTFYKYYCVFCHGENGDGNGPVGKSYIPKPSILTSKKINGMNDGEIYNKMLTGEGHYPVLEKVISADYRWYIVLYVKYGLNEE